MIMKKSPALCHLYVDKYCNQLAEEASRAIDQED